MLVTFVTAVVMVVAALLTAVVTLFTVALKPPPVDELPAFELVCVVVPLPFELPTGLVFCPLFSVSPRLMAVTAPLTIGLLGLLDAPGAVMSLVSPVTTSLTC